MLCEWSDELNGECDAYATAWLTFDPDVWTDDTPIPLCDHHSDGYARRWKYSSSVALRPL